MSETVPSNTPAQSPSLTYLRFTPGPFRGTDSLRNSSQELEKKQHLTISDLIDAVVATEWSSQSHNYTHTDFELTFNTSHEQGETTVTPLDTELRRHFDGGSSRFNSTGWKKKPFLQTTPLGSDQPLDFLEFPEPRTDFFLDDPVFPSSVPQSAVDMEQVIIMPPLGSAQSQSQPRPQSQSRLQLQSSLDTPSPTPSTVPPSLPPLGSLLIERPLSIGTARPTHMPRLRMRKEVSYVENEVVEQLDSPRLHRRLKRLDEPASRHAKRQKGSGPRSKTGCWTCRVRKKKCFEDRPSCRQCSRLGLTCDGYDSIKPDFMTDSVLQKRKLDGIKTLTDLKKKIGVKGPMMK